MIKTKVNTRSITAQIDKTLQITEDEAKRKLLDIAEDISGRTRVDTGAFAESWSVQKGGSGSGRVKSARGRPRGQSIGQYQQIAYSNMAADIEALPILEIKSATFRNRAAHAPYVPPTRIPEGKLLPSDRDFSKFVQVIKDRYR